MIEFTNYNRRFKKNHEKEISRNIKNGKKQIYETLTTTLEARLSFKEETAPTIREEVMDRIFKYPLLDSYLFQSEKIHYYPINNQYLEFNNKKERKISIKKSIREMSLDIKITSPKDLKSKQLLDLEALNEFIVRGQYPEKPNK